MLGNHFGQFDDSGRVFSITDPRTPMPWVNVICNGRYGLVVSQNGGGFSWLDNSQLNVLTRWEMDLARDSYGKFLFLSDLDTGDVWSASPAPCRTQFAAYQCDHTLGATTFHTEYVGIRVKWTLTVTPDDPVELWHVEIENRSSRKRRLRVASFFEWCCGVAPDTKREFHRLFFTTRHDAGRHAIVATKNMWDVPPRNEKEHWNRPWPYVAAHSVAGIRFEKNLAIADKSTFLGRYGDPSSPAAMKGGAIGADGGRFGRFGDAAAALGGDLTLAAGEHVKFHYLLTIGDTEQAALANLDKYRDAASVKTIIRDATDAWDERLMPTQVSSDQSDFDLLNNHWLPYQAISARLWGRTGYFQQSGAFGFRDQLQDSQVWLPRDPAMCRKQILLHAAHQFADGSVYHWWHPLTETGLRTACSDDYLWLAFVTINYLKETGDYAILDEIVPFVDDAGGVTLQEHCLRAIERCAQRLSPRGLPLIGSCDWNDGLSAMGVDGKGESAWLAFFVAGILKDFGVVMTERGEEARAGSMLAWRTRLIQAIEQHCWDGEWYRCATRDDGRWIGTRSDAEGKVYLNPQTWAVLTGIGSPERRDSAWHAVREHLLHEMGPVLLSPGYTEPDPTIGYVTRYAPGLRENGGVYMHAATWALAAACVRRDVASVEKIWNSISPPLRSADAEMYRAEPYVMPGNVDGPSSGLPGRAGWTWYTGSAAWLNRVCMESVLGIRPTWDGLLIEPCPFAGLGKVDVTRLWRGRRVRVRFDAREYSAMLEPRLMVNGQEFLGNVLGLDMLPDQPGTTGRVGATPHASQSGNMTEAEIDVLVEWGIKVRPVADGRTAGERTTA
ncbi:MAG: glycosyl transferase family 36 [Pyrinomonadaceae bacterium]|nr:glycosyl transferase family 36 [Phycisphaerales bacterium]